MRTNGVDPVRWGIVSITVVSTSISVTISRILNQPSFVRHARDRKTAAVAVSRSTTNICKIKTRSIISTFKWIKINYSRIQSVCLFLLFFVNRIFTLQIDRCWLRVRYIRRRINFKCQLLIAMATTCVCLAQSSLNCYSFRLIRN